MIREINFWCAEGVVCMNDAREYLDPRMKKFLQIHGILTAQRMVKVLGMFLHGQKSSGEELIHNPKLQDKTILIASHGCAVRALLHNVYKRP